MLLGVLSPLLEVRAWSPVTTHGWPAQDSFWCLACGVASEREARERRGRRSMTGLVGCWTWEKDVV